ncbi:hypothetical protein SEES8400_20763 [Salmonella enterica subsp. enterica serovar Senftenberg str. ATCC 8400]|nr:hypothetical protein SEES8400_20763 [Salmonella enterica subsp. enterica serovar Senftenberg str. ATCC 8400]
MVIKDGEYMEWVKRKAKISRVQRERRIASEVIMGRVGYVKAGYRWLR